MGIIEGKKEALWYDVLVDMGMKFLFGLIFWVWLKCEADVLLLSYCAPRNKTFTE